MKLDIASLELEEAGGEGFYAHRSQHKGIDNGEIPEGLSGFILKRGMCVEKH